MNNDHYTKRIDTQVDGDEGFWSEDYVWATSEESKRNTLSLHSIGSIVYRHGGTLMVETETQAVHIDVPDEKRLSLAEELSRKLDMRLQ